jgi:predicted amidohydrolase
MDNNSAKNHVSPNFLRVLGLQLSIDRDSSNNLSLLETEIRKTVKRFPATDLVLLPELACFGVGLQNNITQVAAAYRCFAALAEELSVFLVPGSFYCENDAGVVNQAPVFSPDGQLLAKHDKLYPFLPHEVGVVAGKQFTVFDVPDVGRIGLCICYDLWFPEVARALIHQGAEVILHPTLTTSIDRDVEHSLMRATAAANQCYVVDVNAGGTLGVGQSIIVGSGGEVIHHSQHDNDAIYVELNMDQLRYNRQHGWHGLGQVLKSYRDGNHQFPQDDQHGKSQALTALGSLTKLNGNKFTDKSSL